MSQRNWSKQDLAYLREHYGKKTNAELAQDLGRTVDSVKGAGKIHRLVKKKDYSHVRKVVEREALKGASCKDIAEVVLRETGVTIRDRYVYEHLSRAGIREQWLAMDEKRASRSRGYYNRWQDWEDDFIEQCRGEMTMKEMAVKLERTYNSVKYRCWFLRD